MSFFGWTLKRDKDSDVVADLKRQLEEAQKAEVERQEKTLKRNSIAALPHLRAVERYVEQMDLSKGAHKAQLLAIIESRLEKVKALGVDYTGNPTATIRAIENGN